MIDLRGWIAIARTCRHCGGPLFVVIARSAGRSYTPVVCLTCDKGVES